MRLIPYAIQTSVEQKRNKSPPEGFGAYVTISLDDPKILP